MLVSHSPPLVDYQESHQETSYQIFLWMMLIFRGLNPTNMSTDAMLEFLQNWLKVSKEVDASCYSLLLHLPIFLAYNQPTNFALIYSK
ncbi:hypothetical protein E2C01_013377 [Portunus trituberculatus]|uniref:Letm1 RBD domain-containing protein n=1 Tax=Portunus trituberculatus TaxID=210409 RepID=A0A5B7DGV4_PORTR|nr:hypothetical protein [Portunus trituberculatus]